MENLITPGSVKDIIFDSPSLKFIYYSAHDDEIVILLNALSAENVKTIVPYASNLFWELR
jgi:hypothetical protein